MPPGVEDEALTYLMTESNAAVACTKSLLTHWVQGDIIIPKIEEIKTTLVKEVEVEPEDPERLKMRRRLGKAAEILKKHRKRDH